MKQFYLSVLFVIFLLTANSQCPTTSNEITVVDYCAEQYAEFVVDNPDPQNRRYQWFEDRGAQGYYSRGYSNHYISPQAYPTGTGDVSAFYSVEINETGGPTHTPAISNGADMDDNTLYTVDFSATDDITINYISVIIKNHNPENNTYRLKLSFTNTDNNQITYSDWYYFGGGAMELISNGDRIVRIPVRAGGNFGVDLASGNYTVRAFSTADGLEQAGTNPVDFSWFDIAAFDNSYNIGSSTTIDYTSNTEVIWGGDRVPAFLDWDITVRCPMQELVAEETIIGCCFPVYEPVSITTSTGSYVVESPFSITLTANASDTLFYRWYKDGIAIPGAEGIGALGQTIQVTQTGRYSVRAVDEEENILKYSCYNDALALIQERILFIEADTLSLCSGESVRLVARGATGDVLWTAPTGVIDNPNEMIVNATPGQSMQISVEATVPAGNQIINGDFEQGWLESVMRTGNNYTYKDPSEAEPRESGRDRLELSEGDFTVNDYVFEYHPNWRPCADHTTGSGNFLYANTASQWGLNPLESYIWAQDVIVEPNTDYEFAAWFMNIDENSDPNFTDNPASLPKIMIYIDNQPLLPTTYDMNGEVCLWEKVSSVWNSGNTSGVVTLKIAETSFVGTGVDWAMDDITFGAPTTQTADIFIEVDDCLTLDVSESDTICLGDSVEISAITNGSFLGWTPDENVFASNNETTLVYPTETTTYTARAIYQTGNLVVNGDFESGQNVGYTIPNGITAYYVRFPKIDANNEYYADITDHTSGSGNMLLFDPSTTDPLYSTTVFVEEGTEYIFSVWVANAIDYIYRSIQNPNEDPLSLATPLLRFYVNGQPLTNFDAPPLNNDWVRAYSTWISDVTGPVTISFSNEEASFMGNDFAIDDISFAPMVGNELEKTLTITVEDCLPPAIDTSYHYCEDLPVGSGRVANIDLIEFEEAIKGDEPENTIVWYMDEDATQLLETSLISNYTAENGDVLYAQVTNSGGVSNVAEISFVVNPLPNIEFPTIEPLCMSDELEITGITPEGGTLTGGSIVDGNRFVASVLGDNTIEYDVTIDYANNVSCSSTKEHTIVVNDIPETDWNLAAIGDTTYCGSVGVNLSVTAVSGATYTWSDGGSTTNINNGVTSGTYTVTLEKDGCSFTTREINVIGSETPTFTLTGGATYCPTHEKQPLTLTILTGTAPFSFNYKIGAGDEIEVLDQASPVSIDVTADGEYFLTKLVDANGCEALDYSSTTTVVFNEVPVINFDDIVDVCANATSVNIANYVTFPTTAGTSSFTVDRGTITDAGILTPDGVGDYLITARFEETGNICPSEETKTLTINPLPQITFNPGEPKGCVNTNILVSPIIAVGSPSPYQYLWTSADGVITSAPALQNATINTAIAGNYTVSVRITDANQCVNTEDVVVNVTGLPTITIDPLGPFCHGDDAQTISVSTVPTSGNGVFSGTGVDATSGEFTPSNTTSASVTSEITYTFTDDNECVNSEIVSIVVNPLPSITATPSREDACVSDLNSEVITYTLTGTNASGTGEFTSSTIIFEDSELGTINPQNNNAGTHNILYSYEDANGCKATQTSIINIHNLPEVSFATTVPAEVCIYDDSFVVEVLPESTGQFMGAISTSQFNPSVQGAGEHTIQYRYTDGNGCRNSASHTIEVIEIPRPDIVSDNPKTVVVSVTNELSTTTELEAATNIADATISWYDNSNTTLLQDNALIYNTGITSNDIGALEQEKSFIYSVRQHSRGCYSLPREAELILSRCPALVPQAEDVYYCVGETGPFELTASFASGTGDRLDWFENSSDATPMAGFSDTDRFTSSTITGQVAETQTVYVAEYDIANTCWSSKKMVTIHVVDNPTVSITTASENVCRENGEVEVRVSPIGGTFTSNDAGFNPSTRYWDLETTAFSSTDKTLELSYLYEETQPDGKVCSTTETLNITAHYIDAPIPHNRSWLISDIPNIPSGVLTADRTTGVSIEWYSSNDLSDLLHTGDNFTPDLVALELEASGLDELPKTYYIRQIDAQGCASELVPIVLSLVQCPFDAPTVSSITVCMNDNIDNLVASPQSGIIPTQWKWYSSDDSDLGNNSNEFIHGIDNSVASQTEYYVSYLAIEINSGNECETPRTPVSVTVNPLPVIEFASDLDNLICYDATSPLELRHTINYNSSSQQSIVWSVDDQTLNAAMGGYFDARTYGELTDDYVVRLTATDQNSCVGTQTHNITVQYVPKPTIPNHIDRLTLNNTAPLDLIATPNSGATNNDILWYSRMGVTLNQVGTVSPYTMPESQFQTITSQTFSDEGQYYFYAKQSINGCLSDTARLRVVVRNCPAPTPTIPNEDMCDYDSGVEVTATYGNWASLSAIPEDPNKELRWFTANTPPNTQTAYNTGQIITIPRTDITGSSRTFYVAEYSPRENCYSPLRAFDINIDNVNSLNININPSEICEGQNLPIASVSNPSSTNTIRWYIENPGTLPVANAGTTGNSFQFTESEVGSNHVWALVDNGSCQSQVTTASFTVHERPVPIVINPDPACAYENDVAIRSEVSQTGSRIRWYRDSSSNYLTENINYIPNPNILTVGDNIFYAREISTNNCVSFAVPALYVNKEEPAQPTNAQLVICEYEPAPTLSKEPASDYEAVRWYNTDGTVFISEGNTLQFPEANMNNGASTTIYRLTHIKDGCESQQLGSYTVSVIARPVAPEPIVIDNCVGQTNRAFRTLPSQDVIWYKGLDSLAFRSTYQTDITDVGIHQFHIVRLDANGCRSLNREFTYQIFNNPTIVPSQNYLWSCEGSPEDIKEMSVINMDESVQITNFEWRNEAGRALEYNSSVYTPQTRDFIKTGENRFSVVAKSNLSCPSDTVYIDYDYRAKPMPPLLLELGNNVFIDGVLVFCQGEELSPIHVWGENVVWYDSLGLPFYDDISYTPSLEELRLGENVPFSTRQTINNCTSDPLTIQVRLSQVPQGSILGPDKVCEKTFKQIYTIDKYESGNYFEWDTDSLNNRTTTLSESGRSIQIDFDTPGIDVLGLTEYTPDNCSFKKYMTITTAPKPEVDFDWDMPGYMQKAVYHNLSSQDSIFAQDTSILVTYSSYWNYGREQDLFENVHSYIQRNRADTIAYKYGNYDVTLRVENDHGCIEELTKNIFVDVKYALYVPNAFSPTSFSHSLKSFRPVGFNLTSYEISIYDSWGNLLWYSDKLTDKGSPAEEWDGKFNEIELKSDNYIWKINARFVDGSEWEGVEDRNGKFKKYGNVVLIR